MVGYIQNMLKCGHLLDSGVEGRGITHKVFSYQTVSQMEQEVTPPREKTDPQGGRDNYWQQRTV